MMKKNMMESFQIINIMVMGNYFMKMVNFIRENLKMEKEKERVLNIILMKKLNMMECF